ncbi:hypothetical protein [Hymenobacter koreensis]|uniref:DUF2059 domain-containing protein n=1 Tax=Hymenobacter koreensis TaxID=1084523 RepID=A0ABP8IVP7_9BACT
MIRSFCIVLLSWVLALSAAAQTAKPAAGPEAQVNQYFNDYIARMEPVYSAPTDAAAITLIDKVIKDFSPRQAVLAKSVNQWLATASPAQQKAALMRMQKAPWVARYSNMVASPQLMKFMDREKRNSQLKAASARLMAAKLYSAGSLSSATILKEQPADDTESEFVAD